MPLKQTTGSRCQVMHGTAKKTTGGLTKSQLKYNKQGKIVSKKASALAKKNNRLVKAGYVTRKGVFGIDMRGGEPDVITARKLVNIITSHSIDTVLLCKKRSDWFSKKKTKVILRCLTTNKFTYRVLHPGENKSENKSGSDIVAIHRYLRQHIQGIKIIPVFCNTTRDMNKTTRITSNNKMPDIHSFSDLMYEFKAFGVNIFDSDRVKYETNSPHGHGAYGTVYKYSPSHTIHSIGNSPGFLSTDATYAIKETYNGISKEHTFNDIYMETISLQKIKSQHVIKFVGVIQNIGLEYICSIHEYCNGKELTHYFNKRLGYSEKIPVFQIILQIALGIKAIHDAGIVHQDIKDSNVMICESDGQHIVKIIDFGLSHRLTNSIHNAGSIRYRAPETLKKHDIGSHADILKRDIYSFGILVNALLLTHECNDPHIIIPYNEKKWGREMLVDHVLQGNRPTLCITEDYVNLIQRCWDDNIGERPAANQLVNDIKRIQGIH